MKLGFVKPTYPGEQRVALLPDYSIVASGSVVNKDFSNCGKFCFYAGIPAKLKKTNIKRIFDVNEEKKLDEKYHYNRTKL